MLQPKDTDWLNGYKNKTCIYAVYKRPTSDLGTHTDKVRAWKKIFHANGNQKKAGVAILISDKTDFKIKTITRDRRQWHNIFKVMKGKNLQPRLLYPPRISFRFDGEIKSFTDKQKLREFSTTKPALQQMLKELL